MIQVKTFEALTLEEVEKAVNTWLTNSSSLDIKDISFRQKVTSAGGYSGFFATALYSLPR